MSFIARTTEPAGVLDHLTVHLDHCTEGQRARVRPDGHCITTDVPSTLGRVVGLHSGHQLLSQPQHARVLDWIVPATRHFTYQPLQERGSWAEPAAHRMVTDQLPTDGEDSSSRQGPFHALELIVSAPSQGSSRLPPDPQSEDASAVLRSLRGFALEAVGSQMLGHVGGWQFGLVHQDVIGVCRDGCCDPWVLCDRQVQHSLHDRRRDAQTEAESRQSQPPPSEPDRLVRPESLLHVDLQERLFQVQ